MNKDNEKILIRPLLEKDLDPVSKIESECFSMPWSKDSFRALLENTDAYYVVAEVKDSGEIAGVCGLRKILDEGDISNVAVKETFRNQGIGKALVREALTYAEKLHLSILTLEVRVSNAPAIALYESLHFEKVGIRPGFYELPEEDALMMKWYNTILPWANPHNA
ncbi:MAG: ribosomal protein S18-alanine N-acetyltransferase [Lachnospiraceae bacterium]|nr:ribosomal protein S18-alanine N-acetyltransferase [Lachnospiraceae bacterium]